MASAGQTTCGQCRTNDVWCCLLALIYEQCGTVCNVTHCFVQSDELHGELPHRCAEGEAIDVHAAPLHVILSLPLCTFVIVSLSDTVDCAVLSDTGICCAV